MSDDGLNIYIYVCMYLTKHNGDVSPKDRDS